MIRCVFGAKCPWHASPSDRPCEWRPSPEDDAKLRLVAHLTPEELELVLKRAEDVEALDGWRASDELRSVEQYEDGAGSTVITRHDDGERSDHIGGTPDEARSAAALWVKEHGSK